VCRWTKLISTRAQQPHWVAGPGSVAFLGGELPALAAGQHPPGRCTQTVSYPRQQAMSKRLKTPYLMIFSEVTSWQQRLGSCLVRRCPSGVPGPIGLKGPAGRDPVSAELERRCIWYCKVPIRNWRERDLNFTRTGRFVITAVTLALAACGGGDDLPQPASLEKTGSGDGQQATAGNRLSRPFSVRVKASDGTEVPRAEVRWVVSQGDGAILSDSLTVTDGIGVAHAYLTLGPTAGTYTTTASLVQRPVAEVSFTAQAVAAPELTAISPATFSTGDEIVLVGAHLSDSVIVEVAGRLARVQHVSAGGGDLTAVVPRCLMPGPVAVTVRVGLATSAAVTGTYLASSEPLRLGPGEYVSVEPVELDGCARFEDAVGDSGPEEREYLMAAHSVTSVLGSTLAYRLKGDTAATPVPLPQPTAPHRTVAERFHDFLRLQEEELGRLPREPLHVEPFGLELVEAGVEIGDRRAFRVCDKVTCSAIEDFTEVRAEAKYVGKHAVIYEDLETPEGGFTAQDFSQMGALFDSDLYEVATVAFGVESDIDRNGAVLILLTPVVNGLTEEVECSESFITGFFFPIDVDPRYASDQRSNQAEIFYSMVADPEGAVTCEHSVDRVKRLVPITFIHELQHMINFSQHVIIRGGSSEQTWLNEAMSHISEELGGLHFEALGDQSRFTAFSLGNLFNAYQYLENPQDQSLLYRTGTGTLEERGASWLFLRWIADQFGAGVFRRLTETDLVGTENVIAATGEPLSHLLADWFLANFMSDHPSLNPVPDRLSYQTWNFRTVYSSLHDQDATNFPKPYPLEPMVFTGGNIDVSGLMRSGSGAYYRVIQSPGQRGFSVALLDESGNPLTGEADPRLSVIRIR